MLVNGKGGAIQELLRTIADGSLGDPRVSSVKSLMTTARRRRIVETLHGYGKVKPGDRRYGMIGVPDDVVFNRQLIRELQNMADATARLSARRGGIPGDLVGLDGPWSCLWAATRVPSSSRSSGGRVPATP